MTRVALVYDWLTGMRGAERVLETLIEMYPDSEIFTLVHVPGSVSRRIEAQPIHASFVNRLPLRRSGYRFYLPFFPAAVERFDLQGFDLVLSTSHCVAKGARPVARTPHLCYCLTPMRYAWDLYDEYFGPRRASLPVRVLAPAVVRRLRRWDRATAGRVDAFVACSKHVQERIRRIYDRPAEVVYPPVAVERFTPGARREDFYVTVSALVPYKRIDVAIEAFNRLGKRLVIIGVGSERRRLQRLAGPTIVFTGRLPDGAVVDYLRRCRGFVFCATEDFGIAPVEAQAVGAPVIAFGAGGVTESVVGAHSATASRPPTGVFFHEQTPEALVRAVEAFERMRFDHDAIRANAERFAADRFKEGVRREVHRLLAARRA